MPCTASSSEELVRGEDAELAHAAASACISPLVEVVLAADESIVSAAEFQRVMLLLNELYVLDPLKIGVDWCRQHARTPRAHHLGVQGQRICSSRNP